MSAIEFKGKDRATQRACFPACGKLVFLASSSDASRSLGRKSHRIEVEKDSMRRLRGGNEFFERSSPSRTRKRERRSRQPRDLVLSHLLPLFSLLLSRFPCRFVTPPHLLCFSRFALGFSYSVFCPRASPLNSASVASSPWLSNVH
jgi:hypothetical protein